MKLRAGFVAIALWLAVPRLAHARERCRTTGDAVGESDCTTYGMMWSDERRPKLFFRLDMRGAVFNTSGLTFKESYDEDKKPRDYRAYRFRGDELGTPLRTIGAGGSVAGYVAGQLYLGVEGGFALGTVETATFEQGGSRFSSASGPNVILLHGGAPIGYRVPLGRLSLRGEVLFGGAVAFVTQRIETNASSSTSQAIGIRGIIEPRAHVEIWLTQHMTLGAYAGANVVDQGAPVIGLSFAWHARSYDGASSW